MLKLFLGAFAATVALSLPLIAVATAQSPPPAIRSFDQSMIELLGMSMYIQDHQAALATDVLFAETSESSRQGIRGWIVTTDGAEATVRFVRERGGMFEAAYDVRFRPDAKPTLSESARTALALRELAQFKARELALRNIERPCSQRYNAIVLPEPGSDHWLVWMIAATTAPNLVQAGGHYRFTISGDGETLLSRDALSRSCIVVDRNQVPPGSRVEALTLTHIVSETPIETHIFLSLLHQVRLVIAVPDGTVWGVEQGRMRKVGTVPAAGPSPK